MKLRLFHHPAERLRATKEGECSYLTVKPAWAAPLSRPNSYLSLLNGKSEEIALIVEPEAQLSSESWAAVREELHRRDLTARINAVTGVRSEYGATYWTVQTDRGEREFVTQNLQENALWYGETRLLLLDVEGNRFEIPDLNALDARSRGLVDSIL